MHFVKLVLLDGEQLAYARLLDIRITVRCKILMFLLSSTDSLSTEAISCNKFVCNRLGVQIDADSGSDLNLLFFRISVVSDFFR